MLAPFRRLPGAAAVTLAALSVGCDQATKAIARETLAQHSPMTFLGGVLRLQYAENRGAFLSLGAHLPGHLRFAVFTVFGCVILLGLLVFAVHRRRQIGPLGRAAFALLIAGSASNLVDRMVHGGVVIDFLNLGLGSVRTGIFNVADVAIVAGVALLLLADHASRRASASSGRGAAP